MKKIGILLVAIVFGTTVSMAQNRGNVDPKERATEQTKELKETLGLDKDQEKKVYDLNLKAGNEMAEMRKDMQGGGDRDAMREKMTKSREAQNKEMKKILTEDQYKKYEKYLEERRARRGQGGGGGNR